ncbi:sulfurtransferase TusA family protein [Paracoccus sp. p4-l81]|uniref:sulfurtransferase TusA family protein n=1 Tax=unclassified Paracoccus (in: a-proteobacteria) TaxID=2688777 RepID=UPI0035BAC00E
MTQPDQDIDARHLLCPLPVLRARKALNALPKGAVLRMATTDGMALIDLPHFCDQAGHQVIDQATTGDTTVWLIRRG